MMNKLDSNISRIIIHTFDNFNDFPIDEITGKIQSELLSFSHKIPFFLKKNLLFKLNEILIIPEKSRPNRNLLFRFPLCIISGIPSNKNIGERFIHPRSPCNLEHCHSLSWFALRCSHVPIILQLSAMSMAIVRNSKNKGWIYEQTLTHQRMYIPRRTPSLGPRQAGICGIVEQGKYVGFTGRRGNYSCFLQKIILLVRCSTFQSASYTSHTYTLFPAQFSSQS